MSRWANMRWQVSVLQLLTQPRKFFTSILLPILFVFFALQSNWVMASYDSLMLPSLAFLAAIMTTTWYGGFLPAVFSTVLSAFTVSYYFFPPIYTLAI
jgi:K+-sensing histidine kinase KdpD